MPEYRKASDYLTVEQAAKELLVHRATAYRLISSGHIRASLWPAARHGGRDRIRITRTEIDRYLGRVEKNRKGVA